MLENPGFEDGFYHQDGQGELQIGTGWTAWYEEGGDLKRPEYKEEKTTTGSGRVHSGDSAQKMFTTFAKHDAGIWQPVDEVTPGQWYEFSGHVYVWSSQQDNPDESTNNGKYAAMIGVNPWGHWFDHYATVWGRDQGQDRYNEWVRLRVFFEAYSERVALFVRGRPEWAVKHNDSYWDSFALVEVSAPGTEIPEPPEPPEPPTPGECKFFDVSAQILRAQSAGYLVMSQRLKEEAQVIEGLRNESFLARAKRWISRR